MTRVMPSRRALRAPSRLLALKMKPSPNEARDCCDDTLRNDARPRLEIHDETSLR